MTPFKQGDVILIPFPFTDFSTFKQRPAVVLSSEAFNFSHPDLIVAAITSHLPESVPQTEFLLEASDLKAAGLPKASLVKLGKIVTLDQRLIRKRLGTLPPKTVERLLAQFRHIF